MLAATATVIVATGQTAANIIILSLTVVAVSFVGLGAYRILLPLVSSPDATTPALIGGRTRAALEREKQLVLRSIKELEFDFGMGKVSKTDFEELSGRLRSRAFGLMRQLDEGGGYREQIEREVAKRLGQQEGEPKSRLVPEAAVAVAADQLACPECETANDPDARFCKNCGTRLAAE
jgi:hypothetical protein